MSITIGKNASCKSNVIAIGKNNICTSIPCNTPFNKKIHGYQVSVESLLTNNNKAIRDLAKILVRYPIKNLTTIKATKGPSFEGIYFLLGKIYWKLLTWKEDKIEVESQYKGWPNPPRVEYYSSVEEIYQRFFDYRKKMIFKSKIPNFIKIEM